MLVYIFDYILFVFLTDFFLFEFDFILIILILFIYSISLFSRLCSVYLFDFIHLFRVPTGP